MYITIDKALMLLGISRATLYRLINAGEIRTIHLSSRVVRIEMAEIERFLTKKTAEAYAQ